MKKILFRFSIIEICFFITFIILFGTSKSPNLEMIIEEQYCEIDYNNMLEFYECLSNDIEANTDEINQKIKNLDDYLSKYNVSVLYSRIDGEFQYVFGKSKIYYAASTIKMLDAIYVYEKAINGEIDLDSTVLYQEKHIESFSPGVSKYKIGDSITMRNLVKFAIIYSDNSAHLMLVDYIGKDTLKQYGKSLGAKYSFYTDNYGYINLNDSLIYLKKLNELFNINNSLSNELKSYFINSDINEISPDDNIESSVKYGEYGVYHNELGIIHDYNNEYYLVILSREANKYETLFKDISKEIYDLHNTYINTKQKLCKNILIKKNDTNC